MSGFPRRSESEAHRVTRSAPWQTAGLLLTWVAVTSACQQPPGHPEDVLAADVARIEAMVEANRERLEAVLHESLTYTHSNGGVDSKMSLIENLVAGRVDYRSIDPAARNVRVRGDTAVITGPVEMIVEAAGQVHHLTVMCTACGPTCIRRA